MQNACDPYALISDPETECLLRVRVRLKLAEPGDAERLAAVDAERQRRRGFTRSGTLETPRSSSSGS